MPEFIVTESHPHRAQMLLDLYGALRADQNTSYSRKAQQPGHCELHQAEPLVMCNCL